MSSVNAFVARSWPEIEQLAVTEWAVLSLLFPTHVFVFRSSPLDDWSRRLPGVTALAERLVASSLVVDAAADGVDLVALAGSIWSELGDCVGEVDALARVHD
jgi:hypothetical protein